MRKLSPSSTPILSPVKPHELTKQESSVMREILRRVIVAATIDGRGDDLMLRVYMTGIFHGFDACADNNEK